MRFDKLVDACSGDMFEYEGPLSVVVNNLEALHPSDRPAAVLPEVTRMSDVILSMYGKLMLERWVASL